MAQFQTRSFFEKPAADLFDPAGGGADLFRDVLMGAAIWSAAASYTA
jgi:hypothetical protein